MTLDANKGFNDGPTRWNVLAKDGNVVLFLESKPDIDAEIHISPDAAMMIAKLMILAVPEARSQK